jgi:prepilin-type processing-associated H-X9-DG protein
MHNLKMVYLNYGLFESDHGGVVTRVSTNDGGTKELVDAGYGPAVHFRAIAQNEGRMWDLVCPRDRNRVPADRAMLSDTNVSYFLSVNPPCGVVDRQVLSAMGTARWVLAGDRRVWVDGALGRAGWREGRALHGQRGYILFLDGRVESLDSVELQRAFEEAGNWTNRLAIPP